MDRATKAIKRGSIRLKSYSEVNLIISDLNEMRSCGKSSIKAYQTFIEDLIKWAHQELPDNVKNTFTLLSELTALWNEVHNEFFENLKKFRQQFELILESDQAIDKARNSVGRCQQVETQLCKDLEKLKSRADGGRASDAGRYNAEAGKANDKLKEAKRASELAKIEGINLTQKESENKIVKLIPGQILKKLTESHTTLAHKCTVIMQAQRVLCNELPADESDPVTNREAQFMRECKVKNAIAKAKIVMQTPPSPSNTNAASEYDPPPPYSPFFGSNHPQFHRNSLPSTSYSMPGSAEGSPHMMAWWHQVHAGHRYAHNPDVAQVIPEMQIVANMQNSRIS